MKVAFGLKAHSGWAALVALGKNGNDLVVVDRSRLQLVENEWAKQPYHAAKDLSSHEAHKIVKRGIASAHRIAGRELRAAVKRERDRGNEVVACAVLTGSVMPEWTMEQILAVHFRMHQAEGALFRDALMKATTACEITLLTLSEKALLQQAEKLLRAPARELMKTIASLGRSAGPPWGKDQKDSALAAMVALMS